MNKSCKNRGAALIYVLVIMALFTVLTLSLVLASSILMNQSPKKSNRNQSQILAVSLSKALQKDLEAKKEGSIYTYAQKVEHDSKWPYYDNDENGHTKSRAWKTFTLTANAGNDTTKTLLSQSEVVLYWQPSEEDSNIPLLFVQVTSDYEGESYTVTTSYLKTEEGGWSFNERQ